ncbi:hypothetical protein ACFV8T_00120 [Streptomyces sp. NPDC059832]|uniref:hypothetical protein n=1 Tax=Streptomyces sp. NPDC059832 TaxID=3346966 RepID=UPI00364EF365
MRAPAVASAVRGIEEVVLLNRASLGSRYGILLHGPTGTGKTTALQSVAGQHLHLEGAERPFADFLRDQVPVTLIYAALDAPDLPASSLTSLPNTSPRRPVSFDSEVSRVQRADLARLG